MAVHKFAKSPSFPSLNVATSRTKNGGESISNDEHDVCLKDHLHFIKGDECSSKWEINTWEDEL